MYIASELQRNKDTVRCTTLSAEVPARRQEQLTQTLIVRLLKTHLFLLLQNLGASPLLGNICCFYILTVVWVVYPLPAEGQFVLVTLLRSLLLDSYQPRVQPVGSARGVVDEVRLALVSVSLLPVRRQRAQLLLIDTVTT